MAKKPKVLFDGKSGEAWARCWKERRNWIVQVWNNGKPEGEPDGDWEMPGVFPMDAAIGQAVLQSK